MGTTAAMRRKSLAVLFLSVVAAGTIPIARASTGACESEDERRAIGEILSLAVACKQVFPDLTAQVDRMIQPLQTPYAPCLAEYERPGRSRNLLEVAVAMGKGGLNRNKTQFCVTDLEEGVKNVQTYLKK